MKRTMTTVVFAGLAILAFALLNLGGPLQHWGDLPAEGCHALQLVADGGAPMPPWPGSGTSLLADGGAPMPPWPGSGTSLLADGGIRTPSA